MQVAAQQLKTDAGGAEQRILQVAQEAVKDSSQWSTLCETSWWEDE